jgi:hypothetical protein
VKIRSRALLNPLKKFGIPIMLEYRNAYCYAYIPRRSDSVCPQPNFRAEMLRRNAGRRGVWAEEGRSEECDRLPPFREARTDV